MPLLRKTPPVRACFLLLALTPLLLQADVEHGSILLLNDPVVTTADLSLGPDTSPGVTLPAGSNEGDYWLDIDPPGAGNEGILISSVCQNGRGGNYVISSGYPGGTALRHFISTHRAPLTAEDDINVAFAFFPKAEFLVGQATNPDNNEPLDQLAVASAGISFSTAAGQHPGAEFVYDGVTAGVSTLDLTGLGAHSADGVLLVNGAKNENNFALSRANADGTFTIFNHDLTVDGASYESDPVSFAYVPADQGADQIVALGRIDAAGGRLVTAGNYEVSSGNDGTWTLQVHGHDPTTGTLVISPEGGGGNNVDNIWSYEWDAGNQRWLIQTRDLTGLGLQALGTGPPAEAAFSFVFVALPPRVIRVDKDAGPGGNGSSWGSAYRKVQDALAVAGLNTEIWVAEGTYYPDEGSGQSDNDRSSTFALANWVELYGGFAGNESSRSQRNPAARVTVLSGDLDQSGTASGNAYHVVTADGVNPSALLDGFTVTAGNADGSAGLGQHRGGGMLVSNASPSVAGCIFTENQASDAGGALFADGSSPVFDDCQFTANGATVDGGAIRTVDSTLACTDCLFAGNRAAAGGGVQLESTSPAEAGFQDFANCTFAGNSGGALHVGDNTTPTVRNSLFWNNADGGGSTATAAASVTATSPSYLATFDHCLIANSGGSASWDPAIGTDGGGNLDGDPRFVLPAAPASAPTAAGNYRMLAASPAIDAGDNAANTTGKDVVGSPRVVNSGSPTVDIGAFEFQNVTSSPTASFSLSSGDTTDDVTITFTVTFNREVLLFDAGDLGITTSGSLAYTSFEVSGSGRVYTLTVLGISGEGEFDIGFVPGQDVIDLWGNALSPGSGLQNVARLSAGSPIHYVDASSASPTPPYATWATAAHSLQDALLVAYTGDNILVAEGTYYPDEGELQSNDNRSSSFTLNRRVNVTGGHPAGGGSPDPATYPTILSGDLDQDDGLEGGGNSGNAYHVVSLTGSSRNAQLVDLRITGGHANGGSTSQQQGGGLRSTVNGFELIRCLVDGNSAQDGGGAFVTRMTCRDCRFEDNFATARGGGLSVDVSLSPIVNTTFRGNTTDGNGGAIFYDFFVSTSLTNCLLQGNHAGGDGGAIYTFSPTNGPSTVVNTTFQGNRALGNYSAVGGVVVDFDFVNSIVWGNQPDGFAGGAAPSSIATLSGIDYRNCLIAHSGGSAGWSGSNGTNQGGNLDADPLFVAPVDPATTPTTAGDLHLQFASPAIGSGYSAANAEAADLDGNPRLVPLAIDMGPYEANQLDFLVSDLVNPAAPGESASIPGWASNGTLLNPVLGVDYTMTLVGTLGDVATTSVPTVSPNGTLNLEIAPGEGGFLTYEVTATDPNGIVPPSASRTATFRIPGYPFRLDPTATGNGNGRLWADAFTAFPTALAGLLPGDKLWVAEGTYLPQTFAIAVSIFGGFPAGGGGGTFEARNPAAFPSILTGDIDDDGDPVFPDPDNANHVVTVPIAGSGLELDGFTIVRGFADGAGIDSRGGAITVQAGAEAHLANLTCELNRCVQSGGAIAFENGAAVVSTLRGSVFNNNQAGSRGGAVWVNADVLEIEDCEFRQNMSGLQGGAISFEAFAGGSRVAGCLIEGNHGSSGGGMYSAALLEVDRCRFVSNTATSDGGGVQLTTPGVTIRNTLFSGNSAARGGGVYDLNSATTGIYINCAFAGNRSNSTGGGIEVSGGAPGFRNVTFQGNRAGYRGGGIYSTFGGNNPFLDNVLIWNNSSEGTTVSAGASLFFSLSPAPIFNHCMLENWTKGSLDTSGTSPDTNLAPADPLFARPVDPPTAPSSAGNLRLLPGSPAIDVGDDAANNEPLDIVGNPRKNGTIDLGAYEGAFVTFGSLGFTNPTGDDNGNGWSNFADYAAGGDPTLPDDPALRPSLSTNGNQLVFSFRNDAADLDVLFLKSATLLPGSWIEMVEGADYNVTNTSEIGSRTVLTLDLLVGPGTNPRMFFLEQFLQTGP